MTKELKILEELGIEGLVVSHGQACADVRVGALGDKVTATEAMGKQFLAANRIGKSPRIRLQGIGVKQGAMEATLDHCRKRIGADQLFVRVSDKHIMLEATWIESTVIMRVEIDRPTKEKADSFGGLCHVLKKKANCLKIGKPLAYHAVSLHALPNGEYYSRTGI